MHRDTIKTVVQSIIEEAFTFYDIMAVDPVIRQEPVVRVSVIRYSLGIDDVNYASMIDFWSTIRHFEKIHHTGLLINDRYVLDLSDAPRRHGLRVDGVDPERQRQAEHDSLSFSRGNRVVDWAKV